MRTDSGDCGVFLAKISKSRLDMVLDNQLCLVLLEPEKLDHTTSRGPFPSQPFCDCFVYPESESDGARVWSYKLLHIGTQLLTVQYSCFISGHGLEVVFSVLKEQIKGSSAADPQHK